MRSPRGDEVLHERRGLRPLVRLRTPLTTAGGNGPVVLGAAIVLGGAQRGGDRAFLFELEQQRIESA